MDPAAHNVANLRAKGDYYDTQPDEKECITKMKDVRFSTELHRLRTYKKVAQKTIWYNSLLHKILEYQIGEKPLILYALGKSCASLTLFRLHQECYQLWLRVHQRQPKNTDDYV